MAYQHTSMVSVQVLDCASIPTVIVLSVLLMRYRYGALHGVGVFTGLLGARLVSSPLYVLLVPPDASVFLIRITRATLRQRRDLR